MAGTWVSFVWRGPRTDVIISLFLYTGLRLGSCCVDEVAAQHVDADAMVHYGYACMTQCVPSFTSAGMGY